MREAYFCNRNLLLLWKKVLIGTSSDLAPFLSRIVFISKPPLRSGFDVRCFTVDRSRPCNSAEGQG